MAGYSSLQKSYTVTIVRDLTVNIDASFRASFSVDLIGKFPCHFITRTDLTRLLACSLCFYEGKVHSTHKSSVMLHHRDIRTVDTNGNRFVKKLEQQRNLSLASPGGFLFPLNKETRFYAYSRDNNIKMTVNND